MDRDEMADLTIRVPRGLSVEQAEEVMLAVHRAKGLVPMLRMAAEEGGVVMAARPEPDPQPWEMAEVTGRDGQPWSLRIDSEIGEQGEERDG